MDDRQARRAQLRLGLRRQKGDRLRPTWIKTLQEVSGIAVGPDAFLSLQDTAALRDTFFAKVAQDAPFRRFWPKTARPAIAATLRNTARQVSGTLAILLCSVDRDMGATYVPAEHALEHALAVWDVVGEDFCIMTPELHDGLCLGLEFYDANGAYVREGIYELRAWGRFIPSTESMGTVSRD